MRSIIVPCEHLLVPGVVPSVLHAMNQETGLTEGKLRLHEEKTLTQGHPARCIKEEKGEGGGKIPQIIQVASSIHVTMCKTTLPTTPSLFLQSREWNLNPLLSIFSSQSAEAIVQLVGNLSSL